MEIKKLREVLSNHHLLMERCYVTIFSFYYFYIFLGASMFDTTWFVPFYRSAVVAIIAIVALKLFTVTRNELYEWIPAFLFLITCCLCWRSYGDKAILILGLFIVGAKGVSFEKIVKVSLAIGFSIMAAAFIGSKLGYIENLVYYMRGAYRYAFGMNYTTDLAAHILFLILGYTFLKKGSLNWIENIVICLIAAVLYYYTRARANTICMLLVVFLFFIYKRRDGLKNTVWGCRYLFDIVKKMMIFSVPFCGIFMTVLTFNFKKGVGAWVRINNLLTGRLELGQKGIAREGLSLFGRAIENVGLGRSTVIQGDYTAIDSSYILILLERGIIFVIILYIAFIYCSWRAYNYKKSYLLILISIISVQSIIEHHLLDISCNIFVLLLFFGIDGSGEEGKKKKSINQC